MQGEGVAVPEASSQRTRAHALVSAMGVGIGLYRCSHEWPVWLANFLPAASLPAPFAASDFYLAIDAGKIAGVLGYLAVCYLADARRKNPVLLRVLPSAIMVLGGVLPLCALAGVSVPQHLEVLGLVATGVGAGMLFCQWIELCGMLSPLKVVQVLALSYLVRLGAFSGITALGPLAGCLVLMLVAGTAFLQTAWCEARMSDAGFLTRSVPSKGELRGFGGLFAWVSVFAFAYGLGVGSTSMAHAALETGLGTALPMLLILVVSVCLEDRFDGRVLYAIALPLMTAGLVGIEFLEAAPSVSQVLLSAAFDSFRLLAFCEVCAFAYRTRTSAMLLGGCVRVLSLTVDDLAVCLVRLSPAFWDDGLVTLLVVMVAIFVGTLVYLPRLTNAGSLWSPRTEEPAVADLGIVAANAGLSRRETTVFHLLAEGKTTSEISDELFISKGAVRSHTSRIYGKFGVKSRVEFDALFAPGRANG